MNPFKLISFLIVMLICSNQLQAQNILPNQISIHDVSFDHYTGKFEYNYELRLSGNEYELIQQSLYETNFKKEKKKTKPKVIGTISTQQVKELIEEINDTKDKLTINDLGYDYDWFKDHLDENYQLSRELWEKRWPSSPAWNSHQTAFIREQLADSSNISEAVQRRFLSKGYVVLHSSGGSSLTLQLHYKDSIVRLEMGSNYRGLPWKLRDNTLSYNQQISDIIYQIIPENKGWHKGKLKAKDKAQILSDIIDQIYQDECEEKVEKLVYHNYETELSELKAHFKVSSYRKEGSYSNNWDGDERLCMNVKDTNETRNIYFRLCLTLEQNTLFTRDSIIKKGEYYLNIVNRIPFLLDYLDENKLRKIQVSFDNGNSLSDKVKQYQSGENSWANGICLDGKSDDFLNRCVSFALFNEFGNASNWLITPDLDVILVYYQHPRVYKYSNRDLGLSGPSIRYACQHFDLEGNLK